jgi:hypothetical protein
MSVAGSERANDCFAPGAVGREYVPPPSWENQTALSVYMTTTTASVAHRVGRAAIIRPFSFAQRMPFMLTALASSGNPEMCAPNKFLFKIRSLSHLKPHFRSPWSASCMGRLAHRCRTQTLSCAPEPSVPCPAELSPKRSYGWRVHSRDRKVRPYISDRTAHRWPR